MTFHHGSPDRCRHPGHRRGDPGLRGSQVQTELDSALAELGLDIPGLDPAARIQPGRLGDATVWVKTPEVVGRRLLWNRKGNPQRAFERERVALAALQDRGLPVVGLIAHSPRVMVLRDCGPPVTDLLSDPAQSDATLAEVLHASGAALGVLHRAGVSHGRAAPNDFCWQDGRITLIDFERRLGARGLAAQLRRDVVRLVYKLDQVLLALQMPKDRRRTLCEAILAGYRSAGPERPWQDAVAWCRRHRVWLPLIRAPRWPRAWERRICAMAEAFEVIGGATG